MMSDQPRGTETRKADRTVRIPGRAKDLIEEYAEKSGTPQSVILTAFIEECVKYNIFDPEWSKKLKEFHDKVNAINVLNHCPARAEVDGNFKCVHGRPGKTPDIKKLSESLEGVEAACYSCRETLNVLEITEAYQNQINDLNRKLQEAANKRTIFSLPTCYWRSELNNDLTQFKCDKLLKSGYGERAWVSIEEYCKQVPGGGLYGCSSLKYKPIAITEGNTAVKAER